MSRSSTHSLTLTPHPAGAHEVVRGIEAHVTREADGLLTVKYTVHGDASRLAIPAARAPRRADDLWRHTCFEAFIAGGSGPSYVELNFSPSGEWASYEFTMYRERAAPEEEQSRPFTLSEAPTVRMLRGKQELTLEAAVTLAWVREASPLKIALAAVIEESVGKLSYWALRHPPGRPDFHHPDGFALQL